MNLLDGPDRLLDSPFELDGAALKELGPFPTRSQETLEQTARSCRLILERHHLGSNPGEAGRQRWFVWLRLLLHPAPEHRFVTAGLELGWPEHEIRIRRLFPEEVSGATVVTAQPDGDGSFTMSLGVRPADAEGCLELRYRGRLYGTGENLAKAAWTLEDDPEGQGLPFQTLLYLELEGTGGLPAPEVRAAAEILEKNESAPIPLKLSRRPPTPASVSPSARLDRLRQLSSIAAQDADLVLNDFDGDLGGDVLLSEDLYVPRRIEKDIRGHLAAEAHGDAILITGDAGMGKTSLLWSLHRWLRARFPETEVWFLKAGLLELGPSSSSLYLGAAEVFQAAAQVSDGASPLVVLVDTLDLKLNTPGEREALNAFLGSLLELGARLVLTSRRQEARALTRRIRGPRPLYLESYDSQELDQAISTHVRRFYTRARLQGGDDEVAAIRSAVTRGKPLREVCENPLTLRMLFALYAPAQVHEVEVNVCRLYADFWQQRVVRDHRAGRDSGEGAPNLSRTAGAVALTMLREGQPELPEAKVRFSLERFGGAEGDLEALTTRGILRRSREKTLRFFHQTFFEHAAARGLLETFGLDGLAWANARFCGDPGDLFLAPVFEQALVLIEGSPGPPAARGDQILLDLLRNPNTSMVRSGCYVFAHRIEPSVEVKEQLRELLGETEGADGTGRDRKGATATTAWLDFAPNIESHRLAEVLDEAEIIWQGGEWAHQQRILDLLKRLAARTPDGVIEWVDKQGVLEWFSGSSLDHQAEAPVAALGIAFLGSHTEWAWSFLSRFYGAVLERRGYRGVLAEVTSACATNPDDDPATLAERFEAAFPAAAMPKIVPGVVEAHSRLWVRQWHAQSLAPEDAAREIAGRPTGTGDLSLFARLRALAELAVDSSPEEARRAFDLLNGLEDRRLRSQWFRLSAGVLLRREAPAASAYRQHLGEVVARAIAERLAETRFLVAALAVEAPSPEGLRQVLSCLPKDPALWLRRKGLLPILGLGLANQIEDAHRALEQVLAAPAAHTSRTLSSVAQQLSARSAETSLLPLAIRFAVASRSVKAVLKLAEQLEPPAPQALHDAAADLAPLVSGQSTDDPNPVTRREALDAWGQLLRLEVLPRPDLPSLIARCRGESDHRPRLAWLRLMSLEPPEEEISALAEFLDEVRRDDPNDHLRDEVRKLIATVVGGAEDPVPHLPTAMVAVTQPTVTAHHVGLLSEAFSRLARPDTVALVLARIEEIFDACIETGVGPTAAQDVGNKLSGVLTKAFRTAERSLLLPLIEKCRTLPFELARVPISAAFAIPEADLRSRLDEMMDDESLPERTRDLIRTHKYFTERPLGSRGYPDLDRLVDGPASQRKEEQEPPVPPSIEPADLELEVEEGRREGKAFLRYTLRFSPKTDGRNRLRGESPTFDRDPQRPEYLLARLERFLEGFRDKDYPVLAGQVLRDLVSIGKNLYRRLLPEKIREVLEESDEGARSLLIQSSESWVPWELLHTYGKGGNFLCIQYRMGRWLDMKDGPRRHFQIQRLVGIEAGRVTHPDPQVPNPPPLPEARKEVEFLQGLARDQPTFEVQPVHDAHHDEVLDLLRRGGFQALHFAGHGEFSAAEPDDAALLLFGGLLKALELVDEVEKKMAEDRPLIFLNACRVGRQGQAVTGIGGWPQTLIELCRAGALLAPQWAVGTGRSSQFAQAFYRSLRNGRTLGEAVRRARGLPFQNGSSKSGDETPAPLNISTLAYALWGHPNSVVRFDATQQPKRPQSENFTVRLDSPSLGKKSGVGVLPNSLHREQQAAGSPGYTLDLNPAMVRSDLSRLPISTTPFEGRAGELEKLSSWLRDPGVGLASVVAFGGCGKSTLIREFVERLAPSYDGSQIVFAWSFFSQGSQATATTSAAFIEAALRFVEPEEPPPHDEGERVRALARALQSRRILLVLDGIEPLQHPPTTLEGTFRDRGLRDLLLNLARSKIEGLILITSRQPLMELERYEMHRQLLLLHLDEPTGVDLLRKLGVRGGRKAVAEIVENLKGHPLALVLLGKLLVLEYEGDAGQSRFALQGIFRSDESAGLSLDTPQLIHVRRILSAYEELWGPGSPERSFLQLLGLFDRPMNQAELGCLLAEATVAADLPAPPSRRFRRLVGHLRQTGLVAIQDDTYDSHPLIRAWFRERFRDTQNELYRDAHGVLFHHFRESTSKGHLSGIQDLEPLYRAIDHGCQAGLAQPALELLQGRIRQGINYSLYQLGAFSMELLALSAFFPDGWSEPPLSGIDETQRGSLLNDAAYCLISLTRMHEATSVLEAHLPIAERLDDGEALVQIFRHLVESRTVCGQLQRALHAAEQQIIHAETVGPAADPSWAYADHGYVLYHLGRLAEARRQFTLAERRADPEHRPLVGYAGFQLCEVLLASEDWKEALSRAENGLRFCIENDQRPLHRALFQLVLGRAHLKLGRRRKGLDCLAVARREARQSADETLAHVLTMAAREYCWVGLLQLCRDCLDEAFFLVEKAGMELLRIDIWCVEARLALTKKEYEVAHERAELAAQGIEATGYGLRAPELQELEEQLRRGGSMAEGS